MMIPGKSSIYIYSKQNLSYSIKSFAGEDYEKAVYYPGDNGILLEFEEKVNHHETIIITDNQVQKN
jgi:hypothetical protein